MAKKIIIGGVAAAVVLIAIASLVIQRGGDGEVGQKRQPSAVPPEVEEPDGGLEGRAVKEDLESAEEAAARRHIEAIRRGREAMRSEEDTPGGELFGVWFEKLVEANKEGDKEKMDELIKEMEEKRRQRLEETREIRQRRWERLRQRLKAGPGKAVEPNAAAGEQE